MGHSDDDNHDSNDSTSQPANDVKQEKTANNEKANRLRAKPDIPVIFSDSEDSLDGFGYYTKKRKNDSESEDDWAPKGKAGSPKKKVKTEKSPKKTRKSREPRAKKERKPKKEKSTPTPRKPRGRKAKMVVKEENSNGASDELEHPPEKEKEEEAEADGDEGEDKEEEAEADGEKENDTAEDSNPPPELSIPKPPWERGELLAELIKVERKIGDNLARLFENDNTIPFIARYRREMTGDMTPEHLRQAKDAFESIKLISTKAISILKAINKTGKLNPHLEHCIVGARSMVELEHLYAPYKVGGKRTKAEAARQLGLEPAAMGLLEGSSWVALEPLITDQSGRDSMDAVEANISFIMADVISKDKDVLDQLRTLRENATNIRIESCLSRTAKATSEKDGGKPKKDVKSKSSAQNKGLEEGKYQMYYNFSVPVKHAKPHQVLAMNRGENQKVLSVKVVVPDWFTDKLYHFCRNRWLNKGHFYPLRHHFFEKSFKDAFSRLLHPLLARQVRTILNQEAERAAIEVFANNLKKLLLTPPLRGTAILSIDPGFSNGCKSAMISATGAILETEVLYINNNKHGGSWIPSEDPAARKLKELMLKHRCEVIGLGNGKGCRETEEYLSQLIAAKWFAPLDVRYTIVSEQGASIYSCSNEALKEFPTLDRNLISAVSLARRVQDPLSEMVKVEPKHLGVGMYQHDVPEKQLNATLDEVVSECVSFVGVDVNTASSHILRRIAGLNPTRAGKILEWRESNGPFLNRQQLRLVKGIGDKTYEQCAGFIRIVPQTIGVTSNIAATSKAGPKKQKTSVESEFNPLDQTWIHPESYGAANRFMTKCGVNSKDLGSPSFIERIARYVRENGLASLAGELDVNEMVVRLIAEALQLPPGHDLRSELSQPLFRRGVTSLDDLRNGTVLTGRVQNVTHFGTFVDIGVGSNGLIPASRLRSASPTPQLGDRIEVRVIDLDLSRKRITLDLVKIL